VEVNDGLDVVCATLLGWRVEGASVEVNDGLAVVGATLLGCRVEGASVAGLAVVGATLLGWRVDGASVDGLAVVGADDGMAVIGISVTTLPKKVGPPSVVAFAKRSGKALARLLEYALLLKALDNVSFNELLTDSTLPPTGMTIDRLK
jgi:hypothetical protein